MYMEYSLIENVAKIVIFYGYLSFTKRTVFSRRDVLNLEHVGDKSRVIRTSLLQFKFTYMCRGIPE